MSKITERDRFVDLAQKLVKVPKKDIDERIAAEKKERDKAKAKAKKKA